MKRSLKSKLIYVLVVIVGIMLTMVSFTDALAIFKNDIGKLSTKSINDLEEDQLLRGQVEYVITPVAELESTRTVNGIPVSKSVTPYYLVYVNETKKMPDGGYGFYCVMHITDKKTIKKMDNLIFHTATVFKAQEQGSTITSSTVKPVGLEFKTLKMPDEVQDYTYESDWFEGMSRSEIRACTADLMLEQKDFSTLKYEPFMGIGLILIATIVFILAKPRYKTKRTHYVNEGPSDQELMDKYNAPPTPYTNNTQGNISGTSAPRRYNPAQYEQNSRTQAGMMDEINPDDFFK